MLDTHTYTNTHLISPFLKRWFFMCGSLSLSLPTKKSLPFFASFIICINLLFQPFVFIYYMYLSFIPSLHIIIRMHDNTSHTKINMTTTHKEYGLPAEKPWPELKLPELLSIDTVKTLHAAIESDWDPLRRSACQTAAGRALWKHVVHDQLAELLAGGVYLKSIYEKIKKDRLNNAREISGVILAVRTLWFDSKLEAALSSFGGGGAQVVLLGAGMDTRAYRLNCLKDSNVFEVDFSDVLQAKAAILEAAVNSSDKHHHPNVTAKSLTRVAADLTQDDWLQKLQVSGFEPKKNTVWILEGILYYLSPSNAMKVLKSIGDKCHVTHTVLLADFMNKQATLLSSSTFRFYCDWPEELLPSLGFSDVKLSQIGDQDAHFGLLPDPLNLFNKLRGLPRSTQANPDDGTPCGRLYLLQASGLPNNQII